MYLRLCHSFCVCLFVGQDISAHHWSLIRCLKGLKSIRFKVLGDWVSQLLSCSGQLKWPVKWVKWVKSQIENPGGKIDIKWTAFSIPTHFSLFRNMLQEHAADSSAVTFQSLHSGPIWNFSKMGNNLSARLVRISHTCNLVFQTYFCRKIFGKLWESQTQSGIRTEILTSRDPSSRIVVKLTSCLFCQQMHRKFCCKQKQKRLTSRQIIKWC